MCIRDRYMGSSGINAIVTFLVLRRLRYLLSSKTKLTAAQINIEHYYQNNINVSNNFAVGTFLDFEQRRLLQCHIKKNGGRVNCVIVEDSSNLIVVEADGRQPRGRVVINSKSKYVEAMIDRSEPRCLILGIKQSAVPNKERLVESMVWFDDPNTCSHAKGQIDTNRRVVKESELLLLIQILDNTEKDLIPL
eukprot:TRINITY_DN9503_c0_g1_i1.p1 TRINITY_DN9503_c0_g1~~TRINITY_DN9503_c0_g1_i1.p1  ORF type:complete len:217 (+),score=62.15 TRINITY_DN9503_c0_g1_i1:76-651(+)